MTEKSYTDINMEFIGSWIKEGWEWGKPISHEVFAKAQQGEWSVLLTPTKPVPKAWFPPMQGAKVLGLASGGGQQMPIFTALGAQCTVLDYSPAQLESEELVASRENYKINLVQADMTKPLPFEDESFDLIFHPVSNCYVEDVHPIWRECYRVLKKGGILLAGMDNGGFVYLFDDDGNLKYSLPFNPLKDPKLYQECLENDDGIQFSHTIEEQIGGQLKAGFVLKDIYHDTIGEGRLHQLNAPAYIATKAVKE